MPLFISKMHGQSFELIVSSDHSSQPHGRRYDTEVNRPTEGESRKYEHNVIQQTLVFSVCMNSPSSCTVFPPKTPASDRIPFCLLDSTNTLSLLDRPRSSEIIVLSELITGDVHPNRTHRVSSKLACAQSQISGTIMCTRTFIATPTRIVTPFDTTALQLQVVQLVDDRLFDTMSRCFPRMEAMPTPIQCLQQ